MINRAVARTLIGGGGAYSYIHVLPDQFLSKLINLNLISKETSRAKHEYMNKHPPPPPINVLATAVMIKRTLYFLSRLAQEKIIIHSMDIAWQGAEWILSFHNNCLHPMENFWQIYGFCKIHIMVKATE